MSKSIILKLFPYNNLIFKLKSCILTIFKELVLFIIHFTETQGKHQDVYQNKNLRYTIIMMIKEWLHGKDDDN